MVYARVPRHFTLARKLLWVMKGRMPSKVQKTRKQTALETVITWAPQRIRNSRSLREGKGYGQPLQASIVVSDDLVARIGR
jgi:predicted transposase YbfD/YdcC